MGFDCDLLLKPTVMLHVQVCLFIHQVSLLSLVKECILVDDSLRMQTAVSRAAVNERCSETVTQTIQ